MWLGSDLGTQPAVIGLDARTALPADHPVFEFIASARVLDLSRFHARYRADGVGRPPHDPLVMVALILYCYFKHQFTPPQIALACHDDLGARVITGNQYPSERTIRRFIGMHREGLEELLVQTIRIGDQYGLVDTNVIAGDGTVMNANASMGANRDEARLRAKIKQLQQQLVAAHAAWWRSVDPATVAEGRPLWTEDGDQPMIVSAPGDKRAWRKVVVAQTELDRYERALAHLLAHPNREVLDWQDRLDSDQQRVVRRQRRLEVVRETLQAKHDRRAAAIAETGKPPSGPAPVPVEQHVQYREALTGLATAQARAEKTAASRPTTTRVNITDPVSGIMPGKNEGFDQRHNVQAVAGLNQFILAIGTHDSSNDKQALIGPLQQARANLDAAAITRPIVYALYDSGYASEANFTADLPVDNLLVSVEQEARQTGRRTDGVSTARATWATMRTTMKDATNRLIYKMRAGIIEPVFAQLFNRFGTTIHQRGAGVLTELRLRATIHNLLKIHRARRTATIT
jgi:transposase